MKYGVAAAALALGCVLMSESFASAFATGEVTGLTVEISGLSPGGCAVGAFSTYIYSREGSGGISVADPACVRDGQEWDYGVDRLWAEGAVPSNTPPKIDYGSGPTAEGGGYANSQTRILPGAAAGTELSFDVSYAYSYSASMSGFRIAGYHPYESGSAEAYVGAGVTLYGYYVHCIGVYCYYWSDTVFGEQMIFESLSWDLRDGPVVPESVSGQGQNSRQTALSLQRDYSFFSLSTGIVAYTSQKYRVPEPGSLALLGLGLAGLGLSRRRKAA